MPNTDGVAFVAIHFLLGLLFVVALVQGIRERLGHKSKLQVKRGEQIMNALYVMYGVATVAYSLAVDVADFAVGHKTTAIAADYMVLTYLFFFNSWFRNSIALRLFRRIQKD